MGCEGARVNGLPRCRAKADSNLRTLYALVNARRLFQSAGPQAPAEVGSVLAAVVSMLGHSRSAAHRPSIASPITQKRQTFGARERLVRLFVILGRWRYRRTPRQPLPNDRCCQQATIGGDEDPVV